MILSRKLITLSIIVWQGLFSTLTSFAQVSTPPGEVVAYQQDSTLGYSFQSEVDSTFDYYTVRTYANDTLLASSISYQLYNSSWKSIRESYSNYDSLFSLQSYTTLLSYDVNLDHLRKKSIYGYNKDGNSTSTEFSSWNGTDWIIGSNSNSQYEGLEKTNTKGNFYSYSNGELNWSEQYINYYFKDSVLEYRGITSYPTLNKDSLLVKRFYDTRKNVIEEKFYKWDGAWVPSRITFIDIVYSAENKILESVVSGQSYLESSMEWTELISYLKRTYAYDASGNQISLQTYRMLSNLEWQLVILDNDEFDPRGNKTYAEYFTYQNSGDITSGVINKNFFYDNDSHTVGERYFLTLPDSLWVGSSKWDSYYDSNYREGNILLRNYYYWSSVEKDWNSYKGRVRYYTYNTILRDTVSTVSCDTNSPFIDRIDISSDTVLFIYNKPITEISNIDIVGDTLILPIIDDSFYNWISCISGDTLQQGTLNYFVPTEPGLYYCSVGANDCFIQSECISTELLGIADLINFDVYPNPTTDILYINGLIGSQSSVNITNLKGESIISKKVNPRENYVDLSKLKKGLYFVQIKDRARSNTYKIIVE